MAIKKGPKGPRARIPARPARPRITLAPTRLSLHDRVLQKLNLKPSDIFSERETDTEFIFVTKNGMKIRAKK